MLVSGALMVSVALVAVPALATEQGPTTVTFNGTTGTTTETMPSGLTVNSSFAETGGGIDVAGGVTMSAKNATNALYTPDLDLNESATDLDISASDGFGGSNCTAPAFNGAVTTCTNRGTMQVNFGQPVRNPVLHLTGLGGWSGNGNRRVAATAVLRLTGGPQFGAVQPGSTNLVSTGDTVETVNALAGSVCNTGNNPNGGSTAGCGSVVVPGTFTSLSLRLDVKLHCSRGFGQDCQDAIDTSNLVDEIHYTWTTGQDFGDAPTSYQGPVAPQHTVGDLQLGALVDIDDADTDGVNTTTSPYAVAAGSSANLPAGDGADEDAFLGGLPSITQGSAYSLTVPISGASKAGTVAGWIDTNRNGSFDAGERASANFAAGATSVQLNWPATATAGASPGATYARFRTSYVGSQVTSPTGRATSGEVEDYSVQIVPEAPAMTLTKTAGTVQDTNNDGIVSAGDRLPYTFTVRNTGNVPLTGLTVTDNKIASVTCANPTVAVGGSTTCTGTYTLTQADITAGQVDNTATARATSSGGATVQAQGSVSKPLEQTPRIRVVKSAGTFNDANGNNRPDAGETLPYSFEVTNTGNVPLTSVGVTDPKTGPVSCPASPATLNPGQSKTCSATYTLTQADINGGAVDNTATATGTPPSGDPVTGTDTVSSPLTRANSLAMTKEVVPGFPQDTNGNGITDAGDTIRWRFQVTNTGNTTLTNLAINDPKAGTTTCAATTLAPGASTTCTSGDVTITASDYPTLTNTATARARNPQNTLITSPSSSTSTDLTRPNPTLSLDKQAGTPTDANGSGLTDAGDTIDYTFVVENTGNVPIASVEINDATIGDVACPATSLAPGEDTTCTATYTITTADEDDGAVQNTATASGSANGTEVTSNTDTTSTPVQTPDPELTITKSQSAPDDVNGSGLTDAGDTITYDFEIENTGNVPVSAITVDDPKLAPTTITCDPTTLAPGETTTSCTSVVYTITENDQASGRVVNTATARGTAPSGAQVNSAPSAVTTPVQTPAPALELEKEAGTPVDEDGSGDVGTGDTIPYTFTITNAGNVPLAGVEVDDPKIGPVDDCTPATPADLAVGATIECTADYTITAQDQGDGAVVNNATATGIDPDGGDVESDVAQTITPVSEANPSLVIDKQAGDPVDVNQNGIIDAGDTIPYTFVVSNNGNTTVDQVGVVDDRVATVDCDVTTLAPGEDTTCEASYTIVVADQTAGEVVNTASAEGQDTVGGGEVTSPEDSTTTTPVDAPAPRLRLDKRAAAPIDANGDGITDAGDTISYTFEVTNTGNTIINDVAVADPKVGPVTCDPTSLAPGASVVCTAAPYTITAADETSGAVDNQARATGLSGSGDDPAGTTVQSAPDTTSTPTTAPEPVIDLDKRVAAPVDANNDGITDAGDTVSYSFVVTNTGNVPLGDVTLTDPKLGAVTCAATSLAVDARTTCTPVTNPYTITAADQANGSVDNDAEVAGTSPTGQTVTDGDSTSTPTQAPAPALSLQKSIASYSDVNNDGLADTGDTLTYNFTVRNTGNVPLDEIAVADPTLAGATPAATISCPVTTLAPGATTTCTSTAYTITDDDVAAGSVDNTATPSGTRRDNGATVTGTPGDNSYPTTAPAPAITLDKQAAEPTDVNDSGLVDAGDTISYTFLVRNSGNVPLDDVSVDDNHVDTVTCPGSPVTLAAGAAVTCTATYTVTEDDEAAGSVPNTATATGTPRSDDPAPEATDATSTTVDQPAPSLVLTKRAGTPTDQNGDDLVNAGDTIRYTFNVRNNGNVPLDAVTINDAKITGDITCDATTLAPGTATTCATTYTITADDEALGTVDNTATASAADPDADPVTSAPSGTSTPVTVAQPGIEILKRAETPTDVNDSGLTDAGDTIQYSFTVENNGNVVLTDVAVDDDLVGPVTCLSESIEPGGSTECAADDVYTVTEADETEGTVENTATATGLPPDGEAITSAPDGTSTPVQTPAPELSLDKQAGTPVDTNGDGLTDAGDRISYTFVVTNTGNVPVTALRIVDAKVGPTTCADQTLGVDEQTTCTTNTPYTITTADQSAGAVQNVAEARANDPDGDGVVSNSDTTSTPVRTPAPRLTIDKSADAPVDVNGDDITDAGDTIIFRFVVTNTGDVPVRNLVVIDPKVGLTSCEVSELAVGESTTCATRQPYEITTDDQAAGTVQNSATARAVDLQDTRVVSAPDTTSTPVEAPAPAIELDKEAAPAVDENGDGIIDRGDTILYTFQVTNAGNVALDDIRIDDDLVPGVTCEQTSLEPGASTTCTADDDYVITQADTVRGQVVNTATAAGDARSGGTVTSEDDSTETPVEQALPALEIEKTAGEPIDNNDSGITDVGDGIPYTFVVSNPGNVPIDVIGVIDETVGTISCDIEILQPGGSTNCATDEPYLITEDDLPDGSTSGTINNTATAIGQDPYDNPVESDPDTTSTPITASSPALVIDKEAAEPVDVNGDGITDRGDTVEYTFTVSNTGNVPVTLDPASQYGIVDDLVTIEAADCDVSALDDQNRLAVGDAIECTAVYTITAEDEAAGEAVNTAYAVGESPDGEEVRSPTDATTTAPVDAPSAALSLTKTAGTPVDVNSDGLIDAGDTVRYTFRLQNTGNVPVREITVDDPMLGEVTCTPDVNTTAGLAAGAVATCSAPVYTITEDDQGGTLTNTATASGTDDYDQPVSDVDDASIVVETPRPSLAFTKTAGTPTDVNDDGLVDAGDTIRYRFNVTNDGNVPLDLLNVLDPLVGPVSCILDNLEPGESTFCRADLLYTITAEDEAAGTVENTARAQAVDGYDDTIVSNPASTSTAVATPEPALTLVKEAATPEDVNESGLTDAGDTVAYTFTVTNSGNVPVDGVAIVDDRISGATCEETTLAPDESTVCEADEPYVITEADEAEGAAENVATAAGVDRDGDEVTSNEGSTRTPVQTPNPQLLLDKRAADPVDVNGSGITDAGDTIAYTFTVTNNGNVPITDVAIEDETVGVVTCDPTTLAPGEEAECAAEETYVISGTDQGLGEVRNTAIATGLDPDDDETTSLPDSTVTPVTTPAPSLTLDKQAADPVDVNNDGLTAAGDTIAYTFTVTNNGNVPITGLSIDDPVAGAVTCDQTSLEVGEDTSCAADAPYVITDADETAGEVLNTAVAAGLDPDDNDVESTEAQTRTPVDVPAPSLSLDKQAAEPVDVNGSGLTDAGDTIVYTFTVTNNGNVPLRAVAVDDPKVGDVACDVTQLDPGEDTTCQTVVPYTVTSGDVDNGSVDNVATVAGLTNDDEEVVSDPSRTSTPTTTPEPSLTLDKQAGTPTDVNGSGITDAGDTVAFTFVVGNSGNVPVRSIEILDPSVGAVTCDATTLAPTEETTCRTDEPYELTEADEENGSFDNTARASGLDPDDGTVLSEPDSTTTPVDTPAPSLSLDKQAGTPTDVNDDGLVDAGDTIVYTFSVTNTGNVPVQGLVIGDDMLAAADPAVTITCEATTLGPNEDTTCTATAYEITDADTLAGQVVNSATAFGTDPDGGDVASNEDGTTTAVQRSEPELSIEKRAGNPVDENDSGITDIGDTIQFSFEVTNTGNVPVSGIAVADDMLSALDPAIDITCPETTLAPNAATLCTADTPYEITSDDTDTGVVENSAAATGTDPDGGSVTSDPDQTVTPVTAQAPALTLDKQAADPVDENNDGIIARGDTIQYTFRVTNEGNVPLRNVRIDDDVLSGASPAVAVTCPAGVLPVGESLECTADAPYVITEADQTAGEVLNTATALATDPDDADAESQEDTTTTPVDTPVTELVLDKQVAEPVDENNDGLTDAGDTLAFTFVVTNESNVPLTGVGVTDDTVGDVTCPRDELGPGESMTCSAETYTITGGDESAGAVQNTARASGLDGYGDTVDAVEDSTSTPVQTPAPALGLTKTAGDPVDVNDDGIIDRGDTVDYTYVVTNEGNVPVDGVAVTDDRIADVTCDRDTLEVGQSATCSGTYTFEPDDEGTTVTNVATAAGVDRDGEDVESNEDTADVGVDEPQPALSLDKQAAEPVEATGDDFIGAGDTIDYTFTVTNTGNVPVDEVTIDDELVGPVACDPTTLGVGDVAECSATYSITQDDVEGGTADNVATAVAEGPFDTPVESNADQTSTPIEAVPALVLEKVAELQDANGNEVADVGEVIDYTFTLTNTGNRGLTELAVDDPKVGAVTCEATELAPGDDTTCAPDVAYEVTQADVDNGSVDNVATATGLTGDDDTVSSEQAATSTPVPEAAPELTLDKQAGAPDDVNDNGITDAGDTVDFTFTVTNTGNVTIDSIAIDDPSVGAVSCDDATLAPGDDTTCRTDAPYELTAADEENGSFENTASATGVDPDEAPVRSATDSTTTPVEAPDPSLSLEKVGELQDANDNGIADVGEVIAYTFTVTNTGNLALAQVEVQDPKVGAVTCEATELAPGDDTTCAPNVAYEVTQADVDNRSVDNVATALGVASVDGTPVEVSDEDEVSTPTRAEPGIALEKTAELRDEDGDDLADAGEQVEFSFAVTNTGSVTLTDVGVDDPMLSAAGVDVTCPDGDLTPGETVTCTATYVATAADAQAGEILNTATATAMYDGEAVGSVDDTAAVEADVPEEPGPGGPDGTGDAGDSGDTQSGAEEGDGGGLLPDTGGPAALIGLVGLLLVGLGGLLLVARRRTDRS
ncbi:DUF7507 domain-containing protein [Nocardioides panacisoli]|uniref:DUF7507 domain-containing protein n=1 Tax=Nocardioides panacisoli TaxID=627624 RepID=UPI001F1CA2B7|nr:GEVED domain-containing protein [Nocardioides panacisoli]